MKHLTIIMPDGQCSLSSISCIAGTIDVITTANAHNKAAGKREIFKIELAGVSKKTEVNKGVFIITAQVDISTIKQTDLIIIPSNLIRSYEMATKGNQLLIDWIKKQHLQGAEIASMCSGAFMLASSGLLDGKHCSTHWSHANAFTNMFPEINLKTDQLITDENGIYTNGGAYSFLNLLIYLIEKYYGRQTAIYCSKIFQIEMDRNSQSAFSIFTGQKLHEDEVVKKAQAYIETKVHEKISVNYLCSKFSVGRRNFDRRFIKATGNTPVEYAQRVKIESAKKAFETTRKTINEVMYAVGYNDVKAFREIFKRITGYTPVGYKGKYNREGKQGSYA